MSQQFGDDFITITDEDGQEYELEVLASVEYNGAEYLGVCPADAGENEDADLEVSILKVEEEDGEEILCAVTDEEELQAVYDLLMELPEEESAEEDEEDF